MYTTAINFVFFEKAIKTASNNNRSAVISRRFAESLLHKALEIRAGTDKFSMEIVRQALNDMNVRDKNERRIYSSFLSSYFRQRPNSKKKVPAKKAKKPSVVPSPQNPYGTTTDPQSQQLGWRL